jgi:hypothetical protein
VDAILDADQSALRKQRHTAHRIWVCIQNELPGCKIAERTVPEYVNTRKVALGLLVREVYISQSYTSGAEAQIDCYEAYGDVAGEHKKLQVFAMRSMASSLPSKGRISLASEGTVRAQDQRRSSIEV